MTRKEIIDELELYTVGRSKDENVHITVKELQKFIDELKQKSKTGHWIMHIDDLFPAESTMECSECGNHQPLTIDDNYCPNCGAKMKSEE